MFFTQLRKLALKCGFIVTRLPKGYDKNLGYSLYSYKNEKGEFDYDLYKSIQSEGNKAKINNVWVIEDNIKFLARYIKSKIPNPEFGICHGTRRGNEQKWFSEELGCKVIGTEISDTATQFPNTIQWDFHDVKDEWIENVDFIYSNSFDHSYNPELCINKWMSCIKPRGMCILEHSAGHGLEGSSLLDPFGAELQHMPFLITLWGKGKFAVREVLSAPKNSNVAQNISYLIIQKFS